MGLRNKIIGVTLGVAVGLTAITLFTPRFQPNRFTLLPESSGHLSVIEIQYTQASSVVSLPALRVFLSSIDPHDRVIVACGSDADRADARRTLAAYPCEFIVVGKSITGWSKDRFLVSSGKPSTLLMPKPLENGIPSRSNDGFVGKAIAKAYPNEFKTFDCDLFFEAGDILCSGKKVIVSDSLWEKNGRQKTFVKDLNSVFDNDIVWLHDVPDHHIGMYAAPLDDKRVLVGDPDMAKPYWNAKLDREYGHADFSPKMVELFHHAAEQLRKAGYEVVPVPTVPFDQKTYISYTNGVFEKGIVSMPFYGIPALDKMAREAYQKQGMTVKPIPVKTLYKLHGTIGCLVNVLERK